MFDDGDRDHLAEFQIGLDQLLDGIAARIRRGWPVVVHEDSGGGSMPIVPKNKAQSISYPAPGSRPHRHDDSAVDPHVVVLFGATGDLARRKLIPGLAYLDQSELAPHIEIVATSLEDISRDDFLALTKEAIDDFGTHKLSEEEWTQFAKTVTYVPQSAGPEALAAAVAEAEAELGPEVRRLHYLSVPPKAARAVITMLREANLVARSRVVMEKPFGTDLPSAVELNALRARDVPESQIFRIDHFLGKEAAQNILAFRFANGLFEPIWNRNFIDHIQIDIPRHSAWTSARTSTRAPAPIRTWWSPTCSR